jgi:Leucine-rich repeat (LRR) protein
MCQLSVCVYVTILLLTFPIAMGGLTNPDDIFVLKELYQAFDLPSGKLNWNLTCDPCSCEIPWDGITCVEDNSVGINYVSEILLSGKYFRGSVPSSLFDLSKLSSLVLNGGLLYGSFPAIIDHPSLKSIEIGDNRFNGSLPIVANCSFLMRVDFSSNFFAGRIPEALFEGCSSLTEIHLETNLLIGSISSGWLKKLETNNIKEFRLSGNRLSGSIPPFDNWSSLTGLQLYDNLFSGMVPVFDNLLSIGEIDLSRNRLTGFYSDSFSKTSVPRLVLSFNPTLVNYPKTFIAPNLQYLYLDYNGLTEVPECVNSLASSLQSLSLIGNSLHHFQVSERFPALHELYLSENQLVSVNLSVNFPSLRSFYGESNFLTEIPGFSPLSSSSDSTLLIVYLGNNFITACDWGNTSFPLMFVIYLSGNLLHNCSMSAIQFPFLSVLDLGYNLFDSFPSITQVSSINYLYLTGNSMVGKIPHLSMPMLSTLYLDDNDFDELQSDSFIECPSLSSVKLNQNPNLFYPSELLFSNIVSLDLSNNKLINFPSFIVKSLFKLLELNLQSNSIDIMPNLQNLSSLQYLNMSHNQLTSFPEVDYLSRLKVLDLSFNHLSHFPNLEHNNDIETILLKNNIISGTIPVEEILLFSKLTDIDLSFNYFHGSVPFALFNKSGLNLVDLKSNHLSGTFPFFLSRFSVRVLYVSNNYFTGNFVEAFPDNFYPDLVIFEAKNNFFHGQMDLVMLKYPNIFALHLSHNHFSGTLADGLLFSTSLFSCQFNGNNIAGRLNSFLTPALSNLLVLDLSDNRLSGSIPSDFFTTSFTEGLRIFAVSKNCLTGAIPVEICRVTSLNMLALDGMSSAEQCQRRFFPDTGISSYRLKTSIQTLLPTCVLQLPKMETLHISGNGLTGTIPSDVQLSSSLSDLALSYNRLKGSLPVSLQNHSYTVFDLSHNRFNGELSFDSGNNNMTLTTSTNRLSGFIPSSLMSLPNINILDGNLFDCEVTPEGENVLPSNDPEVASFTCGSQSVNNTLLTWTSISCLSLILLFIVLFKTKPRRVLSCFATSKSEVCADRLPVTSSDNNKRMYSVNSIQELHENVQLWWWKTYDISHTVHSLGEGFRQIRWLSITCCVCVVVILLPVESGLSMFRTHKDSYVWKGSLGYLSGQQPALILLFVLFLLFYLPFSVVFHRFNENHQLKFPNLHRLKEIASGFVVTDQRKRHLWYYNIAKVLIILINFCIMITVNVGYIYFVNTGRLSLIAKTWLQIGVAIIKLIWTVAFVKRIFLFILTKFETEEKEKLILTQVSLLSKLNIFNSVVSPLISAIIFDPNCFKYLFFSSEAVETGYDSDLGVFCLNNVCFEMTAKDSISYSPPFIYNYQCTSALLSEFVSVFVYKYAISTLMTLISVVVLFFLLRYHLFSEILAMVFIPKQMQFTIMKLKKENLLKKPLETIEKKLIKEKEEPSDSNKEKKQSISCFDSDMFVIGLIGDFSILVTFGVAFPPLAFIICCSIIFQTVFAQLLIGHLICKLEETLEECKEPTPEPDEQRKEGDIVMTIENFDTSDGNRQLAVDYAEALTYDIRHSWDYFVPSVKYLVWFSCIFVSFFLFDILGDDVGLDRALWIIPVVIFIPAYLMVGEELFDFWKGKGGESKVAPNMGDSVDELNEDFKMKQNNKYLQYVVAENDLEDIKRNNLGDHVNDEMVGNENSIFV